MPSAKENLEYEQKTSGYIRGMTGDIKARLDEVVSLLFDDYEGTDSVNESAKFWYKIAEDIFATEEDTNKYCGLVTIAKFKGIDLWKSIAWKKMMLRQLPKQIRRRFTPFTQVAKLGIMDEPRIQFAPEKLNFYKDMI